MSVTVELGERSYPIHIESGLLSNIGAALDGAVKGRAFVLTDETVKGLHSDTLMAALNAAGIDATLHSVPVGEASKSFATLQSVLDAMFAQNLTRSDSIIAFGGGVVGDLAGFAASIYKRGCGLIQIPTTLLAQVDSSVGGKTAINVAQGKNLVGAFYQPQAVIIDTDVLQTLPSRQVKAGYSEVLKYGLIDDPDLFAWLETHGKALLDLDPDTLRQAISRSCEAKARVVAADEREGGRRALLNLGHTFAHALESVAGYDGNLLHGEAVSAGLAMAFEFSHRSGLCSAEETARLSEHLRELDLVRPSSVGHLLTDTDALLRAMDQDKKNKADQLTLILARGIGQSFIEPRADREAVATYLRYLKARHAE